MRLDSFNPGDGAITGVQASKPTTDWISGQAIEAFFHPVTLRKLLVFRRGTEIYRAEGFGK